MDLMDAARTNALIRYSTACMLRANRVAKLRAAGVIDADRVAALLEEHMRHSSALATMLIHEDGPAAPEVDAAPLSPSAPPVAWWRRQVRRLGLWLTTL